MYHNARECNSIEREYNNAWVFNQVKLINFNIYKGHTSKICLTHNDFRGLQLSASHRRNLLSKKAKQATNAQICWLVIRYRYKFDIQPKSFNKAKQSTESKHQQCPNTGQAFHLTRDARLRDCEARGGPGVTARHEEDSTLPSNCWNLSQSPSRWTRRA